MLRLILVLHLMVVSTAGPWLCCCTTGAMLDCLRIEDQQGQATKSSGCQCNHSKTKPSESPGKQKRPCDNDPCSAKLFRSQPVVLDAKSATAEPCSLIAFVPFTDYDSLWNAAIEADRRTPSFLSQALCTPWGTPGDLLRALCVMRC